MTDVLVVSFSVIRVMLSWRFRSLKRRSPRQRISWRSCIQSTTLREEMRNRQLHSELRALAVTDCGFTFCSAGGH